MVYLVHDGVLKYVALRVCFFIYSSMVSQISHFASDFPRFRSIFSPVFPCVDRVCEYGNVFEDRLRVHCVPSSCLIANVRP